MKLSAYISISLCLATTSICNEASAFSCVRITSFVPKISCNRRIASDESGIPRSTVLAGHPGGHPVSEGGHSSGTAVVDGSKPGFIDTELRGAAMKLHTRSQSPKEGQAEEKKRTSSEPYVTTHDDYLRFLVDSQYVYRTFEDILLMPELHPEMKPFINTGLERAEVLLTDIDFMVKEYGLDRPPVGQMGLDYAEEVLKIAQKGKGAIPELICHYYNYYFAHTAGGRMIGKQMAALLLDKKTLKFYKVRAS